MEAVLFLVRLSQAAQEPDREDDEADFAKGGANEAVQQEVANFALLQVARLHVGVDHRPLEVLVSACHDGFLSFVPA